MIKIKALHYKIGVRPALFAFLGMFDIPQLFERFRQLADAHCEFSLLPHRGGRLGERTIPNWGQAYDIAILC